MVPIAKKLRRGAGHECKPNVWCRPGRQRVYDLKFTAFKTPDTDGPATRAALKSGAIQVGLVFTTDADLKGLGLVVLDDDKNLTAADNVLPILRTAVATDEAKTVLNNIDAKLTTADLIAMIDKVANQHQDADAVATAWRQQPHHSS